MSCRNADQEVARGGIGMVNIPLRIVLVLMSSL